MTQHHPSSRQVVDEPPLAMFWTDPGQTAQITHRACLVGYLVILVVLPAVAALGAVIQAPITAAFMSLLPTTFTNADQVIADTIEFLGLNLIALVFSPLFAWIGVLLSLPILSLARRLGFAGWGTAALTGMLEGSAVVGVMEPSIVPMVILPSALLGLAFWTTLYFMHPEAFVRPRFTRG